MPQLDHSQSFVCLPVYLGKSWMLSITHRVNSPRKEVNNNYRFSIDLHILQMAQICDTTRVTILLTTRCLLFCKWLIYENFNKYLLPNADCIFYHYALVSLLSTYCNTQLKLEFTPLCVTSSVAHSQLFTTLASLNR